MLVVRAAENHNEMAERVEARMGFWRWSFKVLRGNSVGAWGRLGCIVPLIHAVLFLWESFSKCWYSHL
ncbi:hypothetical protein [uncultured Pseudoteredinibacter sp.]|uniref:hypothetical protein n=1 Tax=uncultured Pseudoteredinibacter sp. TaxID=1641701 RepID=UPI0026298427|nr:hypothetical protein [uncultured Pseudoteredinibacter sp.]